MVVEYDGERVEMEEATRREERYTEEGRREALHSYGYQERRATSSVSTCSISITFFFLIRRLGRLLEM